MAAVEPVKFEPGGLQADVERPLDRSAPAARSRRRWRKPVLGGLGLLLVLAAAAAWWLSRGSAGIAYRTARVTRGAITRTVTATGSVNPELTIIVGSYVSGVITEVDCDYNTRVKKGQLCARVDPRPYRAALEQARGQLARDMGQLEGARANLARYRTLLAQDSVSVQTFDDQQALVRQLEGSVRMDRAAVTNATVNLGYTDIVSPVDGTVVARNITVGQTVAASFQTPTLFLIATDLTKMQVDTNVSESDIGAVKLGNPARFSVESYDRPFEGTVAQVRQAPQTVQNVVTYDVVVAVANPQFLLKPGMTATVNIETERRANVVRVPDQALRFVPGGTAAAGPGSAPSASGPSANPPAAASGSAGQTRPQGGAQRARVYVLSGGRPMPVEITTGLDDDTNSEVLAGDLPEGAQVIVGEQRAGSAAPARPFRFGL